MEKGERYEEPAAYRVMKTIVPALIATMIYLHTYLETSTTRSTSPKNHTHAKLIIGSQAESDCKDLEEGEIERDDTVDNRTEVAACNRLPKSTR